MQHHTSANDEQQLLSDMESNIISYKIRKESIRASKEEIDQIAIVERKTQHVFSKKFATVLRQIQAYRDLLNTIMRQINIDVRVEHIKTRSRLCEPCYESPHYVLFAIANKADPLSRRFCNSGYLAFCGDPQTDHINVYEYSPHLGRSVFREYALHLADDRIDKFNIEEMTYYIERYVDKELKRITAQSYPNIQHHR